MKKIKPQILIDSLEFGVQSPESKELIDNNQKSAKEAIKILVARKDGFKNLNAQETRNLINVFVSNDKVIYGKAFDIIKVETGVHVDFTSISDIEKNIKNITVCEIKSTRKKMKKDNFQGYFFGLTTAELLVAQNLKERYRFVFVNINTEDVLELTLKQIFEKAKGIYPQWSISF